MYETKTTSNTQLRPWINLSPKRDEVEPHPCFPKTRDKPFNLILLLRGFPFEMDAAGLNWYLRRVYTSVKVLRNWELISDWSFRLRESDNPAGIDKSVVESFSRLNEVNGGFFQVEFPPVLRTDWANLTVQKSPASACGRKKRKQFYYFHIPADVPTSLSVSGKPFLRRTLPECFFACRAKFTRASWSNHYTVDRIWKGSMEV